MDTKAYDEHFRNADAAGERFVRIHFTYIPPGEKAGEIDAGILSAWDAILESAEKHHLAVLPVLGVWADWNDGSNKETWHRWDSNPYNIELGGPGKRPDELFGDTSCRKLWMKRLETIIKRWAHLRCIVAWEIFSELDLVSGVTEERAVQFTECAASVIRAADPYKRPITASQAGIGEWSRLLNSNALDFIEIHPYADNSDGKLDDLIISTVSQRLKKYNKPVLIGECGLNSNPPRNTLEVAPRAKTGIRHAIWASIVSGAMNGRMLWWQDGCDQFEKVDLCSHYQQIAVSAALFVKGVDYTGFKPIPCVLSRAIKGAMLGNSKLRLGWFCDARCVPPNWPTKPLTGQTVFVDVQEKSWLIEFVDPISGKVINKSKISVHNGQICIFLPSFEDSIAVRMSQL